MLPENWIDQEILRLRDEDRCLQGLLQRDGRRITDPDERTQCLLRLLPRLLQIQRSLRVPRNCKLEPATSLTNACGCAGFEDAPGSFLKPFIRLDQKGFDLCNSSQLATFYTGLMVHECGHILYSRKLLARKKQLRNRKRRLLGVVLNFLEDARIEQLLRDTAPGFQSALHALRCFVDYPPVLEYETLFDALPDGDKLHLLLYTALQAPHLATVRMQQWQDLNQDCPWLQLRQILQRPPDTESAVNDLGHELLAYLEAFHGLFPGLNIAADVLQAAAPACRSRILRQLEANLEDAAFVSSKQPADGLLDAAVLFSRWPFAEAELSAGRMLELAERVAAGETREQLQAGRRFSLNQLEQGQLLGACVVAPFSDDAAAGLLSEITRQLEALLADAERPATGVTAGAEWEWGSDRRTVIETAVGDAVAAESWQALMWKIAPQVDAMRAVFRLRCGGARSLILREQTRGRLDRRRLAQASYQQRVFCRRVERPGPRPLVLGLLLDESGSMCRDNRAAVALEAAALLVESTRLLPGIRMEVFSHTSTGPRNRDCLLRRLYRSGQSDVHAVATYGRDMHENYDHQAILTAAAMLKAAASADAQRLLIVLSDGMPHGAQYAGKQAMDATREAAELVRRTGTQLLAIAIADYAAESIYDARYTLKYTQLQEFPQKFRSLLMRLLRRSAIG